MSFNHLIRAASVAAAMLVAPAAAGAAGTGDVSCKGNARSCVATVDLRSGAPEQLTIALPGNQLRLIATQTRPNYAFGSFRLTGERFTEGRSRFVAQLEMPHGDPEAERLTLHFARPDTARRCGRKSDDLLIENAGARAARGAYRCAQAGAVRRAAIKRLIAGQTRPRVSVGTVSYRCRTVARIPQNMACGGGGTVVRFSTPNG